MTTTQQQKISTPSNTNHKPAGEPAKAPEPTPVVVATPVGAAVTQPAADPVDTAAADPKSGKDADRRIVSVAFPPKVVRQLKLVASVEGVSIASIVVAAVTQAVSQRLPAALAEIAKSEDV